MVDLLINSGAKVNITSSGLYIEQWNPLIFAVNQNNEKMVEYLINRGADVNYDINYEEVEDSTYPLKKAIKISNYNIVKCLINHGADVNFDHDNQYPLENALQNCNDEKIIKFLIDHGADVEKSKDENS